MMQVGFRLLKSKQIHEYYKTVRLNFVLFKEDFLFTVEHRYTDIVTHETYNRAKNKISDFGLPRMNSITWSRNPANNKSLPQVMKSLNSSEASSQLRSPIRSFRDDESGILASGGGTSSKAGSGTKV